MNVAFLIEPKKFEIRKVELSAIKPKQILVKIESCGICLSEMARYLGTAQHDFKGNPINYPLRLGHEPAGIVEEVGEDIIDYQPGDKITGIGFSIPCFAEYSIIDFTPGAPLINAVPRPLIIKVPQNVPIEYGIGEPLKCCATITRYSQAKFGDYVFVAGCGFMGLLIIAGLASKGLNELIACDLVDNRLELAQELGATVTLNPQEVNVVKEVESITNGKMCDVAIEGIGHPPGVKMTSQIIKDSPPPGVIILYGYHAVPDTYDLSLWGPKAPLIVSLHPPYSLDQRRDLEIAMRAVEKGVYPVKKLITHKFQLDDIKRGFEAARSRQEGYIKGIVIP